MNEIPRLKQLKLCLCYRDCDTDRCREAEHVVHFGFITKVTVSDSQIEFRKNKGPNYLRQHRIHCT